MSTITEKLNKNLVYAVYAMLFFFIIGFFVDCSNRKKMKNIEKDVQTISNRLDSIPTKKEVDKAIKIEGLKTSKRSLYDNNLIVRQAGVRPDDKMNEYDKEIDLLEKSK